MAGKILILDDEAEACELMTALLTPQGYQVRTVTRASEALSAVAEEDFDCFLTDLQLADMNGIEVCERVLELRPNLPVIVVTGHGSLEASIAAIRAGAYDFVTKPVEGKLLQVAVGRAVRHRGLKAEVQRLRHEVQEARGFDRIIGESEPMRRVFDLIGRVAPTDATVLIMGESGTGKELVASAIHSLSSRKEGPFVAINCAAVPQQLLESELFGHAKGAFTDAKTTRRGLLVEADNGTLFLDEIAEMPLDMQAKLLRALQERTVRPVGGTAIEVPFNARILAATNRDLEAEVYHKRFREDLYYRIHVVTVEVPPLRQRGTDITLLAEHFVSRVAARHHKPVVGISSQAADNLLEYQWPGNVRELENSIERAVALTQHDHITVEDLPERIRSYSHEQPAWMPEHEGELITVDELERRYLDHVLKLVHGNKSRAARILGYDRRTLYRKLVRVNKTEKETRPESHTPPDDIEEKVRSSKVPEASSISRDTLNPPAVSSVFAAVPPRALGERVQVLLVDDDRDALELLQLLLEKRGFGVRTALSLADARRTGEADIVITDVDLPDGSGNVLIREKAPIPVIGMTGLTGIPHGTEFRICLTKPVRIEDVEKAIRLTVGAISSPLTPEVTPNDASKAAV